MKKVVILLVIVIVILAGCTEQTIRQTLESTNRVDGGVYESKPIEKEGTSFLYIFRSRVFSFGGRTPSVVVNEHEIGGLVNAGYFEISVLPGKYVVKTESLFGISGATTELMIEKGKKYFINCLIAGTSKCNLVTPETKAEEMISKTQLLNSISLVKDMPQS